MKLFLMITILASLAAPTHATPVDEVAQEALGVWKLTFTTPDGELQKPYVVVGQQHNELVAWYVQGAEIQAFSTVTLDGEQLRLTIRPREYGGDVKATLVARSTGSGACAGTIEYAQEYGDSGKLEFRGQRLAVSELGEAETWKIGFVDPNGRRHDARVIVVSVGDRLIGWYSSRDYELPVKEIAVKGGQVEMSIATKTADGEKIDVTFRGKVQGERVTGDVNWSSGWESGSFPFRGKRES